MINYLISHKMATIAQRASTTFTQYIPQIVKQSRFYQTVPKTVSHPLLAGYGVLIGTGAVLGGKAGCQLGNKITNPWDNRTITDPTEKVGLCVCKAILVPVYGTINAGAGAVLAALSPVAYPIGYTLDILMNTKD